MKRFRVTYVKKQGLSVLQKNPNIFAEQIIETNSDKIEIPVYPGMELLAITELLPDIQIKNEKQNSNRLPG